MQSPVASIERVQRFHARLFEIARVPRDHDQAMNERGSRNQTIFDGQRLAGSAEVREKLRPSKSRHGFPRKAEDFCHAFVEPAFQPAAAFSGRQKLNSKPYLAQDNWIDRNLAFVPPQPVNHFSVRSGLGGFAEHVRDDKIGHSVSVDSDSMGVKKPFSGQASNQSTSPSLGGGSLRTSRYSPRAIRSTSN